MSRQRLYASKPPVVEADGEARTAEIFRDHHEFVRDDERDAEASRRWETRMVRRYYDELHKEYAICDLSRWRKGGVGLRWRTEAEVVSGVGERVCAAKGCAATDGLRSYELPFDYRERGEAKRALVKVRVCRACAKKLVGATKKRSRSASSSDGDSSSESDDSSDARKKKRKRKKAKKKRKKA